MKILVYILAILAAICFIVAGGTIFVTITSIFSETINPEELDVSTNIVLIFGGAFFIFYYWGLSVSKYIKDE